MGTWFHFWAGRNRFGERIRVLLGPLSIPPDDPRIHAERFPTRRDHVDGPEMRYLGSFAERPGSPQLDGLDPGGSRARATMEQHDHLLRGRHRA